MLMRQLYFLNDLLWWLFNYLLYLNNWLRRNEGHLMLLLHMWDHIGRDGSNLLDNNCRLLLSLNTR